MDAQEWSQLFDSPWGWLGLGAVAVLGLLSTHEVRDWRHRRRLRGVRHDSGFYLDTGVDNDGDRRPGGGGVGVDGSDSCDGGGDGE